MRRALAVLVALALGGGVVARAAPPDDRPPEERAWIQVEVARRPCFVGESIPLSLLIAYEEAYFRDHAVTTYLRPMDVPLKVEAPWWGALPGTDPAGGDRRPPRVGPARPTFALNDVVTEADLVGGSMADATPRLRHLQLVRHVVARASGTIEIPAATLRFTVAKAFRDDLVGGRVPVDPTEVVIRSGPTTIRVVPLPAEGRPPAFDGAVGRFTIDAVADRREVEVGRAFRLTVRVASEGGPASFASPRLDGLAGFHVFGAIDDRDPRTRTIAFDVAAIDPAVTEVPPIPFPYFDPEPPEGYRVARTDAIPLTVRRTAGARDVGAGRTPEPAPGLVSEPWFLWSSGTLVVLVIFALTRRAKRRARAAAAVPPSVARALAAAAAFRAHAARPDADGAEAFAEFLAARLGSTSAAVIGPDLAARLSAAGAPEDLASQTAATLERLVAARYARAGAKAEAAEGLETLVAALERALRPPRA